MRAGPRPCPRAAGPRSSRSPCAPAAEDVLDGLEVVHLRDVLELELHPELVLQGLDQGKVAYEAQPSISEGEAVGGSCAGFTWNTCANTDLIRSCTMVSSPSFRSARPGLPARAA